MTTLEAEYRGADEVLLALVAFEVSSAATRERPFDLPAEDLVHVAVAINEGFARVLRWRAGQSSPLALVARQVVAEAVAAESLRRRLPVAARELERQWRTAIEVRARLRALGLEAEEVALRMLSTWRLPLDELPAVAEALTRCLPPTAAR